MSSERQRPGESRSDLSEGQVKGKFYVWNPLKHQMCKREHNNNDLTEVVLFQTLSNLQFRVLFKAYVEFMCSDKWLFQWLKNVLMFPHCAKYIWPSRKKLCCSLET